ncbi:MAG: DUF4169 family protein [Alphaproteobacteria bacterium]|nr:DUF4169 family protein [Alphaproteobacteria bacterium]
MSAEIVNLRRARKAKDRVEADLRAAANRAQFGRTKAERKLEAARREQDERAQDGRKLDR